MEQIVWTLWWQGENKAPDIVKACINSMKVNIPYAKVIVLDQYSVKKYIDIPEYILRKFEKGIITIAHLSDFIRMHLLYEYGGLWLDSTIYVNRLVPKKMFSYSFFTIKNYNPNVKFYSKNRWCGFLLGAKSKNQFFQLQYKLLDLYWKREGDVIDYLFLDYFIGLVLMKDSNSRSNYDKCPEYMGDILQMQNELSISKKLDSFPLFNKLSWKNINAKANIDSVYMRILKAQKIDSTNIMYKRQHCKIRKIRSGLNHTLTFLNIKRMSRYGFKIQFYQYVNSLLRTNNSKFSYLICSKYNKLIEEYLSKYVDELLDD